MYFIVPNKKGDELMKKRNTAIFLALIMLLGIFAGSVSVSAAETEDGVFAAADENVSPSAIKPEFSCVYWAPDNCAGWALNYRAQSYDQVFVINLYKNGDFVKQYRVSVEKTDYILKDEPHGYVDFSDIIEQDKTAEYTFDIQALGDGKEAVDSDVFKMDAPYLYHGYDDRNTVAASASGLVQVTNMNSAIPYKWTYEYDGEYLTPVSQGPIIHGYGMAGGSSGVYTNYRPVKSGDTEIRMSMVYNGLYVKSRLFKLHIDDMLNVSVWEADPNAENLFGDADVDGMITASDAAELMQKVLDGSHKMPLEKKTKYFMEYVDVDGDTVLTASDSAIVMQKVLGENVLMPAEVEHNKFLAQYDRYYIPYNIIVARRDSKYFYNNEYAHKSKAYICRSMQDLRDACAESYIYAESLNKMLEEKFGSNYFENNDLVYIVQVTSCMNDEISMHVINGKTGGKVNVELDYTTPYIGLEAFDVKLIVFETDKDIYNDVSVSLHYYTTEEDGSVTYQKTLTWE